MRIPEVLREPLDISFAQAGILRISRKDKKPQETSVYRARIQLENERTSFHNVGLLIKGGAVLLTVSAAIAAFNGLTENNTGELAISGGMFLAGLAVLSRHKGVDTQEGYREAALEDIESLREGSFILTPQE